MIHPSFHASQYKWLVWVEANYPYDGRNPRFATGFDVLRSVEDRQLAADMAFGLCKGLPPLKQDPIDRIPPASDYGCANQPDRRLPPERDEEDSRIGGPY
jgi:hypothetical protein